MIGSTVAPATFAAATSSMRFSAMACTRRSSAIGGSPLLRMAHTWAMEASRPSSPVVGRLSMVSYRASGLSRIHVSPFSTSSRWVEAAQPTSSSSSTSRATALTEEFQRRQRESYKRRNQSLFMYSAALMVFTLGFSYAAVPLYRAFCSATGFSGTPITDPERFAPSRLIPAYLDPTTNAPTKRIRVTFNASASDAIPWSFTPQQKEIYVLPGETALAFYTAKNKSDRDIIGIATYNVSPDRIAPYFAKVECFCFEEQKLLAGEEVDLPVFFFIDTDVLDDPSTKMVDDVVLSYTFFSARRNPKNGQLEPDTDLSKYTVGKDL
ncbi:probable COX11-cytochrome-c oxidase assembly protein [Sporisorium reilianum f. sp. reilianum]|uniref:Probable COX11-cytochrome-c oxidase assembly protein n=1 Tax=Sporisorium reilianum f. sp. reilianum TaxID=72559 RepID=A0A2N8U7V6_9BASI|nr:probable COX11-cytochrome-c oxidase assembly protein [Sporisorium reilianum f. sp. reilianum]